MRPSSSSEESEGVFVSKGGMTTDGEGWGEGDTVGAGGCALKEAFVERCFGMF